MSHALTHEANIQATIAHQITRLQLGLENAQLIAKAFEAGGILAAVPNNVAAKFPNFCTLDERTYLGKIMKRIDWDTGHKSPVSWSELTATNALLRCIPYTAEMEKLVNNTDPNVIFQAYRAIEPLVAIECNAPRFKEFLETLHRGHTFGGFGNGWLYSDSGSDSYTEDEESDDESEDGSDSRKRQRSSEE